MKGYRRLSEGELLRKGDVGWDGRPGTELMPVGGRYRIGHPAGEERTVGGFFYRKARVEGCPEGWRWADAGEVSSKFWHKDGYGTGTAQAVTLDQDGAVKGGRACLWLMPYPEDERLEE